MRRVVGPLSVATVMFVASCSFERPPPIESDGGDVVIDAADSDVDAMLGAAELSSETSAHDFGPVGSGQMSGEFDVIVRNGGDAASGTLTMDLGGANPGDFRIVDAGVDDCADKTLESQGTCIARIQFVPTTSGSRTAELSVSASPGGAVLVDLSGVGLSPGNLEITAGATLAFGATEIQSTSTQQTVTVRNSGGTMTATLSVEVSDATNYTKTADTCDGEQLAAGSTCSVSVRFNPTIVGSLPAQVSIQESETVGVSASTTGSGSARIIFTRATDGGTISSLPMGLTCGSGCTTTTVSFTQTPVTLSATVFSSGYNWGAWSGACAAETSTVCSVSLTAPSTTIGASFVAWECQPDTIVCDETASPDRYVDCSPTGTIEFQMTCPLDCASGVEQCRDVKPSVASNESDLSALLDMADTADALTLSGSSVIDTNTGAIADGGGTAVNVPSMVVDGKRVFWTRSVNLQGTVDVDGAMALVILSDGDIVISGNLDVSAETTSGGPGAARPQMCGASTVTVAAPTPGAGGGSRAGTGAFGGSSANGSGGSPSPQLQDSDLVPLQGGCAGGTAETGGGAGSNAFSFGGGGGGALQLVSRTEIRVTGQIDASGGGGRSGTSATGIAAGGGGGGSGGGVLLEAPSVIVTGGSAVVSTKGGGGGSMGGSGGSPGAEGGFEATAAAGGINATGPDGGFGGAESSNPSNGQAGTGSNPGGGGGGGLGQSRFNTRTGLFSPQNGAAIRSIYSAGTVPSRLVP